jgi:D-proline reductase (dithiol) PrdB
MRGEPFTTGGVHLRSDPPFDVDNPHADWSFREIPTDADTADLAITHTHYNHVDADRDVNCMFPLDRLREIVNAVAVMELRAAGKFV